MALLQKALAYYYPQCSGMPSLVDGNDNDSGSVTPLKYVPNCNSRIPSVADLTDLRGPISRTAAAKEKPSRSTAGRDKPPRSTAVRDKPPRSTAGRDKPTRSTVATVHSSADLLTSTVISMPEAIENENYLGYVDAIESAV